MLRRALGARRLSSTASAAAKEIADKGKAAGIKFYQFSFSDLYGVQRSKLVPASRVEEIAEDGAGFAGFAAWLDMDPTMGDLLAVPDASTLTPLPWKPEVGWLSCNLVHEDAELDHGPRNVLRAVQAKLAAEGGAVTLCATSSHEQLIWLQALVKSGARYVDEPAAGGATAASKDPRKAASIYEFSANDLDTAAGVDLERYRGDVCLVVNVASK